MIVYFCLAIHAQTKIPVLFDFLHHACLNNQETIRAAVILASKTWQATDGILMTDYSSQAPQARLGKHSETLDPLDFAKILTATQGLDFDIMLEIKAKERSAIEALKLTKC
jgi:UV DNA damage endonuclease